jgi:rhodanese-related sulfurtransferase
VSGAPGLDARGLPAGYPFQENLEITPRRVRELMQDTASGLVLIDCRTKAEWQTARIEGARLVPLDELAGRVDEIEEWAEDGPVVLHCHHGGRSMKATLFLRQRGIEARSMAGGIDLWAADVDPTVPRY